MEYVHGNTTIYDWVGDIKTVNSIKSKIHKIEKSKLLSKKNSYEGELCKIMGWTEKLCRHADAVHTDGTDIEIKKSAGAIIFDAVRYAELRISEEHDDGIHVLIIFKKKNDKFNISDVLLVPNWMIIQLIIPDIKYAYNTVTDFKFRRQKKQGYNSQILIRASVLIDSLNNIDMNHNIESRPCLEDSRLFFWTFYLNCYILILIFIFYKPK